MTGKLAISGDIAGDQLVLLDSVIVIDHLNDIAPATAHLASVGGQLATRNTRDFDPSTHHFVVVPYRLDS